MPNIKPISELRNYTEILNEVDIAHRVYLTRNGHGKYGILTWPLQNSICIIFKVAKSRGKSRKGRLDWCWWLRKRTGGKLTLNYRKDALNNKYPNLFWYCYSELLFILNQCVIHSLCTGNCKYSVSYMAGNGKRKRMKFKFVVREGCLNLFLPG